MDSKIVLEKSYLYNDDTAVYDGDSDFGYALAEAGVDPKEIEEVVRYHEGERDYEPWFIVMRMSDGQWCHVTAWCDYTGWDCRAGGEAFYASSEAELVRTKLTQEARRCLGYEERPEELDRWRLGE